MNLREVFINWLTASRFIRSLESRIAEQRMDYTERLSDKDAQIRQLRTDLATAKLECDRMRAVIMPFASPAGQEYARRFDVAQKPAIVPAFNGPDSWDAELNKMYQQEEENGVSGERREIIHEQTADDGA